VGLFRVARGTEGEERPRGEEQVYLALEGRGRFRMGDEDFAVEPGFLFAVPARVEHGWHQVSEDMLLLAFSTPPEGSVPPAPE
jgi:mannose-6-phosphate isomerase-like protein (cupin superfamily)